MGVERIVELLRCCGDQIREFENASSRGHFFWIDEMVKRKCKLNCVKSAR